MVVEKLRPVVGVHLAHRERQAREDVPKPDFHLPVAAPQHGDPLTPTGRHINHLQGMHVLAGRARPAMMDQVDLEMPGLWLVPGTAPRGDRPGEPRRPRRPPPRQPRRILPEPPQPAVHRADADPPELRFHRRR